MKLEELSLLEQAGLSADLSLLQICLPSSPQQGLLSLAQGHVSNTLPSWALSLVAEGLAGLPGCRGIGASPRDRQLAALLTLCQVACSRVYH